MVQPSRNLLQQAALPSLRLPQHSPQQPLAESRTMLQQVQTRPQQLRMAALPHGNAATSRAATAMTRAVASAAMTPVVALGVGVGGSGAGVGEQDQTENKPRLWSHKLLTLV